MAPQALSPHQHVLHTNQEVRSLGFFDQERFVDCAGSRCDDAGAEGLLNALAACNWAPQSLDLSSNTFGARTASCLASCLQCAPIAQCIPVIVSEACVSLQLPRRKLLRRT